jgi:hypothetical protein
MSPQLTFASIASVLAMASLCLGMATAERFEGARPGALASVVAEPAERFEA